VLINDSERYAGEVGKLKNLTGQDTLPYEVKFKQSKGGFSPDALVIVSTNEVIQSSDYTSGLARRRISVPMFNQIKGD
jgi:putative DNA primase/helicase